MKKIILLIVFLILLTGCNRVFNLCNFVMPNDLEFVALIEEKDTPQKICQYMEDNFECENNSVTLDPYQLYCSKKGNCDDFSLYVIFGANWHTYKTWQIFIKFPFWVYETSEGHVIGVFKEGDYYNISDTTSYIEVNCKTFKEIMELYPDYNSYIVYDYDMNIVERGIKQNDVLNWFCDRLACFFVYYIH